jgi:hypothetical protein
VQFSRYHLLNNYVKQLYHTLIKSQHFTSGSHILLVPATQDLVPLGSSSFTCSSALQVLKVFMAVWLRAPFFWDMKQRHWVPDVSKKHNDLFSTVWRKETNARAAPEEEIYRQVQCDRFMADWKGWCNNRGGVCGIQPLLIYSFCSLSNDKSVVPSKASFPQSAI